MSLYNEDVSVALQLYLEDEIHHRNLSDSIMPDDLVNILHSCNLPSDIASNHKFLIRIAQVSLERLNARYIDESSPTMTIIPIPLDEKQVDGLLGDRLNYIIIFGAESIFFQDTVHALSIDSSSSHRVNALGSHLDWISSDGRGVTRAMFVNETGTVVEAEFRKPIPIHVVHILHLPVKSELKLHKKLSDHFQSKGIPQINPYENSSERADDKSLSHRLWQQCDRQIVCPEHILIKQNTTSDEIVIALQRFTKCIQKPYLVIQPNKGTEGRCAEKFKACDIIRMAEYIRNVILPKDEAIIREERGNVSYKTGSFLGVTFRVNAAWNGSEFVAESGYAQVANTFPVSRGRGGTIADINSVLADLHYARDNVWHRFIPSEHDISSIKDAAVNAAYGLNTGLDEIDYLKFIGFDILLEVKKTAKGNIEVVPVILEANSRPAGLSHSSEIIGISNRKPALQVSKELFNFVSRNNYHSLF